MLSDSEIQALLAQLETMKSEVSNLKKELSALNRQKEGVFTKRHALSVEIRKHIGAIKQDRSQRDTLTSEVKLSKGEREEVNHKIKSLLDELHKLSDERKAIIEKKGIVDDPGFLKAEMRKMERMIETGGVSFEREKKLMVQIKKLKKKFDEAKAADIHSERINAIKHELDSLRGLSETAHHSVQEHAQKSQEFHKAILTESKEIDALKDKEAELTKQYDEFKLAMKGLSDQIDAKQDEMGKIRTTLESNNVHLQEEQHRSSQEILKKKEAAVEEKISKRQKLTTEDLLVFQRTMGKGR